MCAGDGVDEMMGMSSMLPCEEEYLGPSVQFGVESGKDVPLMSLPPINDIAGSSSDWILQKVNEIQQCMGITCGGSEDQFI